MLEPQQEDPILKTTRHSDVCATNGSFRRGRHLHKASLRLVNMASGQLPMQTCRVCVSYRFRFNVIQRTCVFEKITLDLKMQSA